MSTQEIEQAIRKGHGEEFLSYIMAKCDARLLDLYLDSAPRVSEHLRLWSGEYPSSPGMVKKLLARGLDPNRPDWLGNTFLHLCAVNGDESVAAVFLAAGADIDARDLEYQGTPLAAAVRAWCGAADAKQAQRQRRMVEFLLKRGAATNLPGDQSWATPLACATRHGRGEIVKLLKQHGAT